MMVRTVSTALNAPRRELCNTEPVSWWYVQYQLHWTPPGVSYVTRSLYRHEKYSISCIARPLVSYVYTDPVIPLYHLSDSINCIERPLASYVTRSLYHHGTYSINCIERPLVSYVTRQDRYSIECPLVSYVICNMEPVSTIDMIGR